MTTTIVEKLLGRRQGRRRMRQPDLSPSPKARIMAYADLTGDHTPVHVDEEYAKTTPFGTRVAHGLFGLSIADGLKTQSDYRFLPGMSLGWTWDFVGRSSSATRCT